MEDVGVVERLESLHNLDEDAPDVLLTQVSLLFLVTRYLLEEVTIVCIFHYDTDTSSRERYSKNETWQFIPTQNDGTYHSELVPSSMNAS